MADDLTDTIRENAQGPAEAKGDSVSVRQHDLTGQITVHKHLESKWASRTTNPKDHGEISPLGPCGPRSR